MRSGWDESMHFRFDADNLIFSLNFYKTNISVNITLVGYRLLVLILQEAPTELGHLGAWNFYKQVAPPGP